MKQLYVFLILMGMVAGAAAQALQSVTPNSGTRGMQTLAVQISGSNLDFSQGSNTQAQVIFSNQSTGYEILGYNFFASGSSSVSAYIDIPFDADLGIYDLNIDYYSAGPVSLSNAFSVLAQVNSTPAVTISPASGTEGTTVSVTVVGHLTYFTQGAGFYIQLPGGYNTYVSGMSPTVFNDSSAQVSFVLSTPPGVYNFYEYDNVNGQVEAIGQFTVLGQPAQIVAATPDSAEANAPALEVSISGLNTVFSSASNTESLWLDKNGFIIYPEAFPVPVSDNVMTAQFVIPANAPDGWYDIHTYDYYDGKLVKKNGFYIYGGVSRIVSVNSDIVALKLFPNPATTQVTLMPDMQQDEWVTLTITAATGQVITRKRVLIPAGKSQYSIDVSLFASGIYTISLEGTAQQIHSKFVVTR